MSSFEMIKNSIRLTEKHNQAAEDDSIMKKREMKDVCGQFQQKLSKLKRQMSQEERELQLEIENDFKELSHILCQLEEDIEQERNQKMFLEVALNEKEEIKIQYEKMNKQLLEQFKLNEKENSDLNHTIEFYKESLFNNEKDLKEWSTRIETYQKYAQTLQDQIEDSNDQLLHLQQTNEKLIHINLETQQLKECYEIESRLKLDVINEMKIQANNSAQLTQQLQQSLKDLQMQANIFQKDFEDANKVKESLQINVQTLLKEIQKQNIEVKEKENEMVNELMQRDMTIINLQEQILHLNNLQNLNDIKEENVTLKQQLESLQGIKKDFENNYIYLKQQVKELQNKKNDIKTVILFYNLFNIYNYFTNKG